MQSVCENSTSLFGLNAHCAYLYRAAAWPLSVQQSQLPISPAELLSVSSVWRLSVFLCSLTSLSFTLCRSLSSLFREELEVLVESMTHDHKVN